MACKILKQVKINIPVISHSSCPAKTYRDKNNVSLVGMSVMEHSKIIVVVCQELCKILPKNIVKFIPKDLLYHLALLHDVGKISPGFLIRIGKYCKSIQNLCPSLFEKENTYQWIHTLMSESAFLKYYGNSEETRLCAEIIGSHHGFRGDYPFDDNIAAYGGSRWSNERSKFITDITRGRKSPIFKIKKCDPIIRELMKAMVSLSDWIGSNEDFFPQNGGLTKSQIRRKARSAIKSLDLKDPVLTKKNNKLLPFKDVFGFDPNEMQKLTIKCLDGRGVYLLESPTGSGKTEAALYAAYKLSHLHNGIFFALPTRMTSDRMYERVLDFIGKTHDSGTIPRLIHALAFISDIPRKMAEEDDFSPGSPWFNSNRRALMLPFGVGTIDQLLMSVIGAKYNFIRLFGLVNKIVILDEVHSYDVYTGKLMDALIENLLKLNCTIIMLSATLTHKKKEELFNRSLPKIIKYPLITSQYKNKKIKSRHCTYKRKIKIKVIKTTDGNAKNQAIKMAKKGQQVVWVCNLVDRAVDIYKFFKKSVPNNIEVGLMHARFPSVYRDKIEKKWLDTLGPNGNRKCGRILIATQVIEQSVDIDADFLITDLAPFDLLFQRAGRLHRHIRENRYGNPEMLVICPNVSKVKTAKDLREKFGLSGLIYSPFILWTTLKKLKKRSYITVPDDIRNILENVYQYNGPIPKYINEIRIKDNETRKKYKNLANDSLVNNNIWEEDMDLQIMDCNDEEDVKNPQTRIGRVPYVPIVLCKSINEIADNIDIEFIDGYKYRYNEKTTKRQDALSALYKRIVMVPVCKELKDLKGPDWLTQITSKSTIPVLVKRNIVLTNSNNRTAYRMTPELGVHKLLKKIPLKRK